MTTVSLAGRLGEIVGANFSFKTRNLREVLSAIEANTGKFRSYLAKNGKRRFAVFVNNKEIDPDVACNIDVRNKSVLIIPVLMGAFIASATAAIVGAMGFSMTVAAGATIATAATIGGKIATFIVGTVLSAALAFGLNLLISKLMAPDDPDAAQTSSFMFGQAENITKQGVVVPVGYGRMRIGSRVVSVNLSNVDRALYDEARGGQGLYAIARAINDPNSKINPTNDGVIQISNERKDPYDRTITHNIGPVTP